MDQKDEDDHFNLMLIAIEEVTGVKLDPDNPEHIPKIRKIGKQLFDFALSKTPDPSTPEGEVLEFLTDKFFDSTDKPPFQPWIKEGDLQLIEGIVVDLDDPMLDDLNASWPLPNKD